VAEKGIAEGLRKLDELSVNKWLRLVGNEPDVVRTSIHSVDHTDRKAQTVLYLHAPGIDVEGVVLSPK
jgi:hypothetical protein